MDSEVKEMLIHDFYLKDTDATDNWDLKQNINMMNVSYSSMMNRWLGSFGSRKEGYAFAPVQGGRISKIKDTTKDSLDTMYRGMIMKSQKERVLSYHAYSLIDLLSAAGGIFSGLKYLFAPMAQMFSVLSFNLGVLNLLFLAKTRYYEDESEENGSKEGRR